MEAPGSDPPSATDGEDRRRRWPLRPRITFHFTADPQRVLVRKNFPHGLKAGRPQNIPMVQQETGLYTPDAFKCK